jgi:hypothetical protein
MINSLYALSPQSPERNNLRSFFGIASHKNFVATYFTLELRHKEKVTKDFTLELLRKGIGTRFLAL